MHYTNRSRLGTVCTTFNLLSIVLAGSDLTIANSEGNTPLHLAAQQGNPTLVKCLLEHGASVDVVIPQLRTPLIAAIANFSTEDPADMQLVIEVLVSAQTDLNAVDEDGNTALAMALLSYDKTADRICEASFNIVPASVCILLIEAGQ